jgi:hypothetical protein
MRIIEKKEFVDEGKERPCRREKPIIRPLIISPTIKFFNSGIKHFQIAATRPGAIIGVLFMDSLHFMERNFYHENAKVGKHENFLGFISCFRHFVLS